MNAGRFHLVLCSLWFVLSLLCSRGGRAEFDRGCSIVDVALVPRHKLVEVVRLHRKKVQLLPVLEKSNHPLLSHF